VRLKVNYIAVSCDHPKQTMESDGFADCLTGVSFVKHGAELGKAKTVVVGRNISNGQTAGYF
jgi:hypothetical protein